MVGRSRQWHTGPQRESRLHARGPRSVEFCRYVRKKETLTGRDTKLRGDLAITSGFGLSPVVVSKNPSRKTVRSPTVEYAKSNFCASTLPEEKIARRLPWARQRARAGATSGYTAPRKSPLW